MIDTVHVIVLMSQKIALAPKQFLVLLENDDNIKKDGKVAVDEKPVVITEEEIAQAEKEVNDDKNVINETEELMGLIAKAKDIREASLNGSMTDAERYEQAEKTAMRLAELFDLMGGGELNEIMG